jgi:hypothetical protein
MSRRSLNLLSVLLLLACAQSASADNDPSARAAANISSKGLDQMVYKGLVGNVLDEIPMDPSQRVSLQRTNAIVSNTWSGHTLSTLIGLSNPVLLIGGLVWGMWAASNIRPEEQGAKSAAQEELLALLHGPGAASPAASGLQPDAQTASIIGIEADEPTPARAPVVKVWLPQRASATNSTQ